METIAMLISHKDIAYKPGGSPAQFKVTVINQSDRFASFQLDITPAGVEQNQDRLWYSISPEVSTKNPPGDAVEFTVSILDTPIMGFVGLVNLTVRTFSLELRDEVRQVIRLELQEGTGQSRIQLELPFQRLQVAPLDMVEIPVLVRNPSQQATNVTLVWNWEQNTVRPVAYPEIGGQDDYIQSMDVPEFRRNLLATADTKGFITVWDMTPCLKDTSQTCNIVDRWGDGHQGKPVRSVGIDPNGCYLVSGGDDGRLMFWGLTAAGRRAGEFANGKPLAVLNANVTAVDVRVQQHQVIAIAGDSTGRVRGYRQDRLPSLGCDR